jgi:hypothetical protein
MIAAINIGALLEYDRPQGVLRRANILTEPSCGLLAPRT